MWIHINTLIFLLEEHDRQVMSIKYGLVLKLLGVCGKMSIALSVTLRGCGPMFTTHPLITPPKADLWWRGSPWWHVYLRYCWSSEGYWFFGVKCFYSGLRVKDKMWFTVWLLVRVKMSLTDKLLFRKRI